MRLLMYMSIVYLLVFPGCQEILDALLPDYQITECSWENGIDIDHDGYTRSRYLVVDYKYGTDKIESASIYVYTPGRTGAVALKYLPSWDVDGLESIEISGLTHGMYNFEVSLSIKTQEDPNGKNATRNYSDDPDLKEQIFETAVQDQ